MYSVANPDVFTEIPERGMGYHLAYSADEPTTVHLVYNHVLALDLAELAGVLGGNKDLIARIGIAVEQHDLGNLMNLEFAEFWPLSDVAVAAGLEKEPLRREATQVHGRVHGSPSNHRLTMKVQSFYRFSAFRLDHRVSSNGFVAGTYATTKRDAQMAPCAFAAIGRYALPAPLPPVNLFVDNVPAGTNLLVGTVAPAFGQAGGGTEVLFPTGTASGTLPIHIPIVEF